MLPRKKTPGMYRWETAAYMADMTPKEHQQLTERLKSFDPFAEDRGQSYMRRHVPKEIADSAIVEHVYAVMIVSLLTYDPKRVGKNGQSASPKTWFFNNLRWSKRYLMREHHFKRCRVCKGAKPAKFVCVDCNQHGWIFKGVKCEKLRDYQGRQEPKPTVFSDTTSQINEPEQWLIDPQGACRVKKAWLDRQTPAVQTLFRKRFMKLPVERRRRLAAILMGEELPTDAPGKEVRNMSPAEKLKHKRKQDKDRQEKHRDPKEFHALRKKLGLGTDLQPGSDEPDA